MSIFFHHLHLPEKYIYRNEHDNFSRKLERSSILGDQKPTYIRCQAESEYGFKNTGAIPTTNLKLICITI